MTAMKRTPEEIMENCEGLLTIYALEAAGYAVVPIEMTAAMLAASKNAIKEYIDRAPPDHRKKLGKRHGISDEMKHQLRWAAAIKAAPR